MSESREWDYPPTMRYHRKRRVQMTEPQQQPTRHRVEITVRHHRRAPPRFLPVFVTVLALLMLWRFKFGVLMLAALVDRQIIGTALFVVAVLGVVAWRDRRAARPF